VEKMFSGPKGRIILNLSAYITEFLFKQESLSLPFSSHSELGARMALVVQKVYGLYDFYFNEYVGEFSEAQLDETILKV
jgi:hypothetical protein